MVGETVEAAREPLSRSALPFERPPYCLLDFVEQVRDHPVVGFEPVVIEELQT